MVTRRAFDGAVAAVASRADMRRTAEPDRRRRRPHGRGGGIAVVTRRAFDGAIAAVASRADLRRTAGTAVKAEALPW